MAGLHQLVAFLLFTAAIVAIPLAAAPDYPRYIMYLTGYAPSQFRRLQCIVLV